MEHVEISPVVVLEAMLKKLCLPCPEYENHVAAEDSFTTKVMFYPSMQFLRTSPHPHSLYSYLAMTLEASTRDAARQAIEYMAKFEKKVPSSFTDADLEKEKKTVCLLRDQLKKTNEKLIQKSNQLTETAVASDTYIESVTEFNRRIKDIILKSLPPGCSVARHRHHASLLKIQDIAISLSQQTAKTIAMLRAAGPSPYGEGAIDGDHSSGSNDSDEVHWMFDPLEIDSDGHPTDYDV